MEDFIQLSQEAATVVAAISIVSIAIIGFVAARKMLNRAFDEHEFWDDPNPKDDGS